MAMHRLPTRDPQVFFSWQPHPTEHRALALHIGQRACVAWTALRRVVRFLSICLTVQALALFGAALEFEVPRGVILAPMSAAIGVMGLLGLFTIVLQVRAFLRTRGSDASLAAGQPWRVPTLRYYCAWLNGLATVGLGLLALFLSGADWPLEPHAATALALALLVLGRKVRRLTRRAAAR